MNPNNSHNSFCEFANLYKNVAFLFLIKVKSGVETERGYSQKKTNKKEVEVNDKLNKHTTYTCAAIYNVRTIGRIRPRRAQGVRIAGHSMLVNTEANIIKFHIFLLTEVNKYGQYHRSNDRMLMQCTCFWDSKH